MYPTIIKPEEWVGGTGTYYIPTHYIPVIISPIKDD